ncbi:MAG: thioredoxin family protein [candidate division Zixibacteria bacterium]|nr:thioredoxin family protein [candidate division Zixibacteria bacterium]
MASCYRSCKLCLLAIIVSAAMWAAAGVGLSADFGMADTGGDVAERLVEVSSVLSVSSVTVGNTYRAVAVVSIEPDWHINSAHPHQDWLIPAELSFDTVAGLTPHSVVYPAGFDADLMGEKMLVYSGQVLIRFQVTVDEDAARGDIILPVRFGYQPCNDEMCQSPQVADANLAITVGDEGSPVNAEFFAAFGESPPPADVGQSDLERLISKYGFWGYLMALGLAFVTGLLLSFSPCTYPMIPITVSIFAGQKRTIGRGFVLSLFYVGSMAIVYGLLGLVVSLVGGVFGAWLASPPVVIAIAAVFVVFALSMFGLYDLNVPMSLRQRLGTAKTGGGVVGAVILGVIAALVVSPCVGPFVAGILLYVATHGSPVVGFVTLFVFALGLGTLFVIIGTFSSAINDLPNSGEWMNSVKRFFGFVLLLMALYFLRTIIDTAVTTILAGLMLIAFGVFGGGLDRLTAEAGLFARLKKFLGILAVLIGAYLMMGTILREGFILPPAGLWLSSTGATTAQSETGLITWETDLEQGLRRARAESRPVLIDTWATWCANCRVLDKRTFGDSGVAAEAERFVPIRMQLEKAGSPTTKDFMTRFALKHYSLPTTILLDSSGTVCRIMQGVIDPDEMLARMRAVR